VRLQERHGVVSEGETSAVGVDVRRRGLPQPRLDEASHLPAVIVGVPGERGSMIGGGLDLEHSQPRRMDSAERRGQLDLRHRRAGADERVGDGLDVSRDFGRGALQELGSERDPRGTHGPGLESPAGQHGHGEGGVGDRPGEHADVVERPRERNDARDRYEAVGPLEADDTAVRRRPEHRAHSLGSDRQRRHPHGHGGGRAGRRSAGRVTLIPRVSRWRRIAIRELGRHGLAEEDRPRRAQPRDRGRVHGRARVGERLRAAGRRHSRDVDDVLHAHRHPMQRPPKPSGAGLGQALVRGGERTVLVHVSPRPDGSVERPDARETRLGELDRAHRPRADCVRGGSKTEHDEVSGWHRGPPRRPRSVRTRA
jgi:hypothetical protein